MEEQGRNRWEVGIANHSKTIWSPVSLFNFQVQEHASHLVNEQTLYHIKALLAAFSFANSCQMLHFQYYTHVQCTLYIPFKLHETSMSSWYWLDLISFHVVIVKWGNILSSSNIPPFTIGAVKQSPLEAEKTIRSSHWQFQLWCLLWSTAGFLLNAPFLWPLTSSSGIKCYQ